jgi:glyoxylase-like metal-dependent hydrolase (beta-lactamase superfamily II)
MGSPFPLDHRVFTVTRPGLGRNLQPGYEPLMWVANSATLIYGEHDAVLVDTFLTNDQNAELVDRVAATGKNLSHIYITHGHGDHFFGIHALKERFPNARAGDDGRRRRTDAEPVRARRALQTGVPRADT